MGDAAATHSAWLLSYKLWLSERLGAAGKFGAEEKLDVSYISKEVLFLSLLQDHCAQCVSETGLLNYTPMGLSVAI